jgi:hypothetical protein
VSTALAVREQWREMLAASGARVIRHHVGGLPDPWCEIVYVDSDEAVLAFELWLAERGGRAEVLGLDSETNALDPWQPGFRARMVQIADPYTVWCIPVVSEAVAWWLWRVVGDYPQFAAHFSEADTRFLGRGLPVRWQRWRLLEAIRWEDSEPHFVDTQGLLALYDPRTVTTQSPKDGIHPKIPRLKGLKETVERTLTPGLKEAEARLHARFRELAPVGFRVGVKMKRWGFANIPHGDPAYLIYGGLDALCGIRLYWLMRAELERRGQWATSLHEQRIQWQLDRATYRGMKVDPPYAAWLADELRGVVAANAEPLGRYGVPPSGMGPAIGAAMDKLREPVRLWNRGKNGAPDTPSWKRAALDKVLADGGPGAALAELLRGTRRADKFRSVQVDPMLRTIAEADGLMHCSMRGLGTVSTRMAAQSTFTSGALHQLPKRDTRVRAAIEARRGHLLVSADFEQGEPFTMAAISGDPQYLADLLEPVPVLGHPDLNSQIALMVYGANYDPRHGKHAGTPHYEMRQAVKFGHLAWCYGCAARKLAALLGRPESEGEAIIARWVARWPQLGRTREQLNSGQYVTLDTGHVIPLWDTWYVDEYGLLQPRTSYRGAVSSRLGLNAATQGTQAQLLKWAMHRLDAAGWSWALRFAMHDELLLEVPEFMAETARRVLEECMTLTYRGVTVRAKGEINGRTWLPQLDYLSHDELSTVDDLEDVLV